MAKIIAIDYGLKRCGIAITDELQIIATSLATVETHLLMDYLSTLFSKENIECLVLGEPKKLDNTISETTTKVYGFKKAFEQRFPDKTVHLLDERFTSRIAAQSIHSMGLKKKDRQNKALLDSVSATLILQQFLEIPR